VKAFWRSVWICALLIPAAVAGVNCASAQAVADGRPMMLTPDKDPLIFTRAKGQAVFTVEIARTEEEKERGLMYRRIFPQDRAMLFVFGEPQIVQMWMANTILPLDMVFADKDGKIVFIYEGAKPFSRNVISSIYLASYVAELNAGAAAAAGIQTGRYMRHPLICGKCEADAGAQ